MVLGWRLGLDAASDHHSCVGHLLPQIRVAAGTVGNLETHTFVASFFWGWLRAREPAQPTAQQSTEIVRIIREKEFGDINASTLLSLVAMIGCTLLALL